MFVIFFIRDIFRHTFLHWDYYSTNIPTEHFTDREYKTEQKQWLDKRTIVQMHDEW
jgi:hypothetical protein